MKFTGLITTLLFSVVATASAQGPALPVLPPQPLPPPPAPMLHQQVQPIQPKLNAVPPAVEPTPVQPLPPSVPTPADVYIAPQSQNPAVNQSQVVAPPTPQSVPQQLSSPATQPAPARQSQVAPHSGQYQSQPYNYSYPTQHAFPTQPSYEFPQNGFPQAVQYQGYPIDGDGINPAGAEGIYVGPAYSGGLHQRFPYYDYRRPWYTRGPASLNVNIVW